jgi:hypothetical protein
VLKSCSLNVMLYSSMIGEHTLNPLVLVCVMLVNSEA